MKFLILFSVLALSAINVNGLFFNHLKGKSGASAGASAGASSSNSVSSSSSGSASSSGGIGGLGSLLA